MLTSLNQFYPRAYWLIATYVMVYAAFILLREITKGTLYEHVLGMGRAFFFMGYTVYALNSGIITQTMQSVTFTVNLEVFLMMIILIGTLDFAGSLLQIINYLAAKTETEEITMLAPVEQEIPTR